MKIGIDISQIVYGTGVSNYTKELVRHLLEIDQENQYILFAGSLRQKAKIMEFANTLPYKNFSLKFIQLPPAFFDLLWNRLHIIPIEKFLGPLDLFHTSDWTQPPSQCPKIATVHDLVPFKFPEYTPKKILSVHTRNFFWMKEEVDFLISPSQSTKQDLVRMGINSNLIEVINEGVSNNYEDVGDEDVNQVKKELKISGSFVLSVGVGARKNTKRIIEAYKLARSGYNLKLVIAGHSQGFKIHEERGVRLVGYVDDLEMRVLYKAASALVYPSLYEGFGLPILEAMSAGTPVVTSNLGSMKEVAGSAAVLVDPEDVVSISDGIKYALNHKKTLSNKGKSRVKNYTWENAAKKTLEVYKRIANKK